jgi:hypothetical protein
MCDLFAVDVFPGDIVDGARRLLSRDHVISRLERVWGPGIL